MQQVPNKHGGHTCPASPNSHLRGGEPEPAQLPRAFPSQPTVSCRDGRPRSSGNSFFDMHVPRAVQRRGPGPRGLGSCPPVTTTASCSRDTGAAASRARPSRDHASAARPHRRSCFGPRPDDADGTGLPALSAALARIRPRHPPCRKRTTPDKTDTALGPRPASGRGVKGTPSNQVVVASAEAGPGPVPLHPAGQRGAHHPTRRGIDPPPASARPSRRDPAPCRLGPATCRSDPREPSPNGRRAATLRPPPPPSARAAKPALAFVRVIPDPGPSGPPAPRACDGSGPGKKKPGPIRPADHRPSCPCWGPIYTLYFNLAVAHRERAGVRLIRPAPQQPRRHKGRQSTPVRA